MGPEPQVGGSPVDWFATEEATLPSDPSSAPLPATYSGRLSLVFTPCPDAERLGVYWEVVDRMAGAGSVVDARPIDGGGAFELVLELGNNVLVVEDLKRQISHTAMVPIAPDRIQINWSPS